MACSCASLLSDTIFKNGDQKFYYYGMNYGISCMSIPDSSQVTTILNRCDCQTVAAATLPVWNKFLNDLSLHTDLCDKVGDMIEILEYIKDWQPSDADIITNNSCGTAWHDGCR